MVTQHLDRPLPDKPHRVGGIGLQDCGLATHWNSVEPVRKAMRDWSGMDKVLLQAQQQGWVVLDTIRGTPTWCADSERPDGYNRPGGSSWPTDLQALEDHVRERIYRYNVASPVRMWNRGPVIKYLKIGNEFVWDFEPVIRPKDAPANWVPRWDLAAWYFMAARQGAIDAGNAVQCLTPAFPAGHITQLADFLAALAKHGGDLAKRVDGVAINAYGHDIEKFATLLATARRIMRDAGLPDFIPIHITEAGHQARHKPAFLDLPEEQQGPAWANAILWCVSQGVASFQTYSLNPGQEAEDAGELYGLAHHPGWARYLDILWPYVGHAVRYDRPGSTPNTHWWHLGGVKRLI
jgi:hypothetical protein